LSQIGIASHQFIHRGDGPFTKTMLERSKGKVLEECAAKNGGDMRFPSWGNRDGTTEKLP